MIRYISTMYPSPIRQSRSGVISTLPIPVVNCFHIYSKFFVLPKFVNLSRIAACCLVTCVLYIVVHLQVPTRT
ncbi:hypothetical protein O181_056508 [Austropuccinia psidii MF-1]|uniref:Uncharacterized protein n=1 Tax=Austropuccinia psidii MF-1 TaxID=1389203 RepID=A0A9Q3ED82_9BASI|nr:hypothetical protein [Austropuccinia psidii MF-1]